MIMKVNFNEAMTFEEGNDEFKDVFSETYSDSNSMIVFNDDENEVIED